MTRLQAVLILLAVILVVAMMQLPKVVVINKNKKVRAENASEIKTTHEDATHQLQLREDQRKQLLKLKDLIKNSNNSEQSLIFADSIADLFKSVNQYDSAAWYYELLTGKWQDNKKLLLKTADGYYAAFGFSLDKEKAKVLGKKAEEYYQKVLKLEPGNLDVQAKMAMTYAVSEQPMRAATTLLEIIQKNGNHPLSLYNLGLLSMQSGQFEKAVDRFEKFLSTQSSKGNTKLKAEVRIYLAESYINTKQESKAKEILKELSELKEDSLKTYRLAALDYLKKIK